MCLSREKKLRLAELQEARNAFTLCEERVDQNQERKRLKIPITELEGNGEVLTGPFLVRRKNSCLPILFVLYFPGTKKESLFLKASF